MRKRGIEIGINFFVMLVISLIVFIFGMAFAFKFFAKSEEYQHSVDANARGEIENLILRQGYRVAAYPTQAELYSGKREILGIGVYNIGNASKTFNLTVSCAKYVLPDGNEGDISRCSQIVILYSPQTTDIKANGDYVFGVAIQNKAAARGTYILNAKAYYEQGANNWVSYGDVQKIYVESK